MSPYGWEVPLSGDDLAQTGVRVGGWLRQTGVLRRSVPRAIDGSVPARPTTDASEADDWSVMFGPRDSAWDESPEVEPVEDTIGAGPDPSSPVPPTGSDSSSGRATRVGHRRRRDGAPADDAGSSRTESAEAPYYSRVSLRRLARSRQRRKWLLAGLAVIAVLVALVSYLRPERDTERPQPLPTPGYALPPLEPGAPHEPAVRVPGLNPILSPPPRTAATAPPAAEAASSPMVEIARSGIPPLVDLSRVGTVDWVHWGLHDASSVDRKRGGGAISDRGGPGRRDRYDGGPQRFSWHDGAHERAESGTATGVYSCGEGDGFALSVAAGPQLRTLLLYVGASRAQGRLRVRLSSGGADATALLDQTDGGGTALYTVTFRAPAGASLLLDWTAERAYHRRWCGNVMLQAAALQ